MINLARRMYGIVNNIGYVFKKGDETWKDSNRNTWTYQGVNLEYTDDNLYFINEKYYLADYSANTVLKSNWCFVNPKELAQGFSLCGYGNWIYATGSVEDPEGGLRPVVKIPKTDKLLELFGLEKTKSNNNITLTSNSKFGNYISYRQDGYSVRGTGFMGYNGDSDDEIDTFTVTIGGSNYGTLSATSSNTNLVSTSISGTTLTVKCIAPGNDQDITITVSGSTGYSANIVAHIHNHVDSCWESCSELLANTPAGSIYGGCKHTKCNKGVIVCKDSWMGSPKN